MVLQVVMFSLREFHNLAPYMEMHIDFAIVRKRIMQNIAIFVSVAPLKQLYNPGGYFSLL